jgi:hypothetical protein
VVVESCHHKFQTENPVVASDGSTPFDRPALLLIDIDFKDRNKALTLIARVEEALPADRKYPIALSPSGGGVKMIIPAALGRGVSWNAQARAIYCQHVFEALVGDIATGIPLDSLGTLRVYLGQDILEELFKPDQLVLPIVLEASEVLESIFQKEKRPAGEFPKITKWSLAPISNTTFQVVVEALISDIAIGKRLNRRDDVAHLSQSLSTFLEDNNPSIVNGTVREDLFDSSHLTGLSELQRAAIHKRGATLFLVQLEKTIATLRFVISMRRWGVNAPRSITFISHGLEQCGIHIHPSQVDALLKRLVDAELLIRTQRAERHLSAAWYQLMGPAKLDYEAKPKRRKVLLQPEPGQWHTTMMKQLRHFLDGERWLEQLRSYPDLMVKPERLREGISLWNNWAEKKNLEPLTRATSPG